LGKLWRLPFFFPIIALILHEGRGFYILGSQLQRQTSSPQYLKKEWKIKGEVYAPQSFGGAPLA